MIFTKVPRLQIETGPTPRRVKNAARAIEKTRQSWGLFAEVVELETPEARVARMDRTGEAYTQRLRDFEAGCWKRGRRALQAQPPAVRRRFLAYYTPRVQRSPALGREHYFCDALYHFQLLGGNGEPIIQPAEYELTPRKIWSPGNLMKD